MKSRFAARCLSTSFVIGLLSLAGSVNVQNSIATDGLLTDAVVSRAGLKVEWFTHAQVDPSRGEIAYMTHFIDWRQTESLVEIKFAGRTESISEFALGPDGSPLGLDGAQRRADARIQVLQAEGHDPVVETVVLPKITLYIMTDQGLVQAIDGETGETLWATPIGSRDHPPLPICADDRTVVAVNGMDVYFLEADTGHISWSRRLRNAPGSGPVISNRFAFVPLFNGAIEAFDLYLEDAASERMMTIGRNFVQPGTTPMTISWGNDRGQLNVAFTNRIGSIAYRVQAERDFLAPAVALPPEQIVACSADGYVHCVHEISGRLEWEVSIGELIRQSPFVAENEVYVVTAYDKLFKIDPAAADGQLVSAEVDGVLSATESRLYCRGASREILAISRTSGSIDARIPADEISFWYTNNDTDRIFVGTKSGLIQCLREVGQDHPRYNTEQDTNPVDEDEAGDGGGDDGSDNSFRARRG